MKLTSADIKNASMITLSTAIAIFLAKWLSMSQLIWVMVIVALLPFSKFGRTAKMRHLSLIGAGIFSAFAVGVTVWFNSTHGADAKASGPLAHKSNPPTPDLTTADFKKRLADYPGVIVSSVVLRPNGNLIPNILKENGVKIPAHVWTDEELRALNQYMLTLIFQNTS